MSLIRNGPHTVTIFLEEEGTDFRGNVIRRPSTTGVTVSGCWMQTVASTRGAFAARSVAEGGDPGQDVSVAYKLICAPAKVPLGWWSRVEWQDPVTGVLRKFAVLGGPQARDFSPSTDHLSCTLQEMR